MKQKYDIIGDIHGHASELARLLAKLGYRRKDGTFKHPERKAIFWATSLTAALGSVKPCKSQNP